MATQSLEELDKLVKKQTEYNKLFAEQLSITKMLEAELKKWNKSQEEWLKTGMKASIDAIAKLVKATELAFEAERDLLDLRVLNAKNLIDFYQKLIAGFEDLNKLTEELTQALLALDALIANKNITGLETDNALKKKLGNIEDYKKYQSLIRTIDSNKDKIEILLKDLPTDVTKVEDALKSAEEALRLEELKLRYIANIGYAGEEFDPTSFGLNKYKDRYTNTVKDKYGNKVNALEELLNIQRQMSETTDEDRLGELSAEAQSINQLVAKNTDTLTNILDVVKAIGNKLNTYVLTAVNVLNQYMGSMDTRLLGTNKTFQSLTDTVAKAYSTNGLVKQQNLIASINTLVEKGIVYNLEERALLATISDKVVSNFDVTNSSLLQLIRIGQADLTQSQMGVQSKILKLLNSTFTDSSYISDLYSGISSAIIEANSLMSTEATAGFDYAIQKWLGSMYSVGMNNTTVSSIATGLNYLATGQASKLTNDSGLMTLFGLSASNAGLNISDLLVNGITTTQVDRLMTAMVKYLQGVAADTANNKVVMSEYANILNMSVSDLAAILNIDTTTLNTLATSTINYTDSINETISLLSKVSSRTSTAEKVNNILDNIMYSWGMNVADNAVTYLSWETGLLASSLGKSLSDSGSAKNKLLGAKIGDIGTGLQLGSGILSLLLTLPSYATSLFGKGGAGLNNLSMFDWQPTLVRGGSSDSGVSYSALLSNKSNAVNTIETLAGNAEVEANAILSAEASALKDVDDLYTALFVDNKEVYVKINSIEDSLKSELNARSILEQIRNRMDDKFEVDIVDNDVNQLIRALEMIKL